MNDTTRGFNSDAVVAAADLALRSGAADFEIGYLHDDVPTAQAGWWAAVRYRGAKIMVQYQTSPTLAASALAERLLDGATCRCGRPVTLSEQDGCRWQLHGQKWEPGCDDPPLRARGHRGDMKEIRQAFLDRHGRTPDE